MNKSPGALHRIEYLDGLRGLAILLVLLFHGFARWAETLPYGSDYADFFLFKYGYLGVPLFFLISGFVILMTLERSSTLKNFMFKRWLRLFPAMLICELLVLLSSLVLIARPQGDISVQDFLPGITFIEPYYWHKFTGLEFKSLEGAYWSLYVEFKFYLIAAVLFFYLSQKQFVQILFCLFMLDGLTTYLSEILPNNSILQLIHSLCSHLSLSHFGWFAAGAAMYKFHLYQNRRWLLFSLLIILISCVRNSESLEEFFANVGVSAFFVSVLLVPIVQRVFTLKPLMILGFVSYPLYLIHENAMVSLTIQVSEWAGRSYAELIMVSAIASMIMVAFIIAKTAEPALREVIKKWQHQSN